MKTPTESSYEAFVRLIKPAERVTFAEIARTLGVTSQAVRLWFNGETPSDKHREALQEHFGIPADGWPVSAPRARRPHGKAA